MHGFWQVALLLLGTLAAATYLALSARVNLSKIAWPRVFRHQYGTGRLKRYTRWLLYWVAISCATSYSLYVLFSLVLGRVDLWLGSTIDVSSNMNGAGAIFLALGTYMYLVRRTHHLCRESAARPPLNFLDPTSTPEALDVTAVVAKSLLRGDQRAVMVARVIFNSIPLFLISGYAPFFRWSGNLLSDCATLLYTDFGRDRILTFWRHHCGVDDPLWSEIYKNIDHKLAESKDDTQRACTVLLLMIRLHGFNETADYIRNYERVRDHDMSCEPRSTPE